MTLRNHSLIEVLKSAFSKEIWEKVYPAIGDTLYMVILSTIFTIIIGLMLGVVLVLTSKEGLHPIPWFHRILGALINCLRSLPSMIMIIIMLPVARLIIGKGYGPNACIIALIASCVPMYGRLIESSLMEIQKGKIEAAKAMGIGNTRILFTIMIPETLPSIIRASTVAIIAVISMTALAGSFGAGGLGDIAVRFGFNRFQWDMLIATVFVLIIMVQFVQLIGDFISKLILKKRFLI